MGLQFKQARRDTEQVCAASERKIAVYAASAPTGRFLGLFVRPRLQCSATLVFTHVQLQET